MSLVVAFVALWATVVQGWFYGFGIGIMPLAGIAFLVALVTGLIVGFPMLWAHNKILLPAYCWLLIYWLASLLAMWIILPTPKLTTEELTDGPGMMFYVSAMLSSGAAWGVVIYKGWNKA